MNRAEIAKKAVEKRRNSGKLMEMFALSVLP
jgi:hypothetical protein